MAGAVESKASPQAGNISKVTSEQSSNEQSLDVDSQKLPSHLLSRINDPKDSYQNTHLPRSTLRFPKSPRPQLQSAATTAVSLTDIHTHSYQDGSRESFAAQAKSTHPSQFLKSFGSFQRLKDSGGSETDTASIGSCAPTLGPGGDVESLLGNVLGVSQESPELTSFSNQTESLDPFDSSFYKANDDLSSFDKEFDELADSSVFEGGEGMSSTKEECILAHRSIRAVIKPMESQEEAFSYIVIRRQAYLQSSWGRQSDLRLRWRDSNHYILLRGLTRPIERVYGSRL